MVARVLLLAALLLAGCGSDAKAPPSQPPATTTAAGAASAERSSSAGALAPEEQIPARGATARGRDAALGASLPETTEAIARLLDARAAALEAGDPRALAATAAGAQRARDRRGARRARVADLRDVAVSAGPVTLRGARVRMRATLRYGVRGIPGRFASVRTVTAGPRRGGWRVLVERARRGRAPWEVAALSRRRTRHFTLLAPVALRTPMSELAEALEAGYDRARANLPAGRLPSRALVVLAAGPEQARALTRGIRGVGRLTAIADAEVREAGAARIVVDVLSQRLLVVWPRFAALSAAGRSRVIAHELTHLALARSTSGRTPAWLVEGLALWASGDRRTAAAAQLADAGRLPRLATLARPDAIARSAGLAQSAAYAVSAIAVHRLVATYGPRRFLRLYDVFNDERLAGRPGAALTSRALRRVLGTSLAALERQVRADAAG